MRQIELAEYSFSLFPDGRWSAPNRRQNLRTTVSGGAVEIHSRTSDPDLTPERWGLWMRLEAWGRRGDLEEVQVAADPVAEGDRIELWRPELTEWYVNKKEGLEQGFTLHESPGPRGCESEVILRIGTTGTLSAQQTSDGKAILVRDGSGATLLVYSGLFVYDYNGAELPSSLALDSEGMLILLDDCQAAYPITVDPLFSSPSWTTEGDQASARYGHRVATAGDVNGDGFDDVIVSAPIYDNGETDEGRVYVYYGSAWGISSTADWTAEGDQASSLFGWTLGSAGDVNGDGYSDIIIGAESHSNGHFNEGMAFVFLGSSSGLGADGTPSNADWSVESDQSNAKLGQVATAGDIDGDNYSDVIIGVPLYDNGSSNEGIALVYFGSSSGLGANGTPANADWTAEANQNNSYMGGGVGPAGDVDGDGYDDVIIGARVYTNSEFQEGAAFVFLGSSTGLGSNGTPSNADWMAESNNAYSNFGGQVGTAGDVDGDGYDEVIIGAVAYDNGHTDEGIVMVWLGSTSGLGSDGTPSNADWSVEGNQASANMGVIQVGSAGDVDNDGYDDVIVGARGYTNGESGEGGAFLYLGSSSGLSTTADWSAEGNQASSAFGGATGIAGDIDGDGCSDVIIGARFYDNGETDEGRAYIYRSDSCPALVPLPSWTTEGDQANSHHGYFVATAGDINRDSFDDIIVSAPDYDNGETDEGRVFAYYGSSTGLSSTADWTTEANQAGAQFGWSISTAGDVDGDGYHDIIIGAPAYDNGQTDEGMAFVYLGSYTGLSSTADWTAEGNQTSARLGEAVGTAGDVDNDGYSEVIIGAPKYDDPKTDEGIAMLWYGGSNGLGSNGTPSNSDWHAETQHAHDLLGSGVGTAGDVNGDGYDDVIVGAPGYDNPGNGEGLVMVFLGRSQGLRIGKENLADWRAEGDQAGADFGGSVGTAGDVDNDGYDDVIVGASLYDNGHTDEGLVMV
jgi:hypothetical protein